MELRSYQKEALDRLINYIEFFTGKPLVDMPTGSGKSPLIAALAAYFLKKGLRVAVLAHVKELVSQNSEKLEHFIDEELGIYCAGLDRKDTTQRIIYGSVQSIAAAKDFPTDFDLIIIDEAHRVPPEGAGQYQTVINNQPNARVVGVTATPYRLGSGYIYGEGKFFDECVYTVDIKKLISDGFLSKLRTKSTATIDTSKLKIRAGEFTNESLADEFEAATAATCNSVIKLAADRKHWIFFASSVAHANKVYEYFNDRGITTAVVTGETPKDERNHLIKLLRDGRIRCLVNVAVFTEGFDFPAIDCVIIGTATTSSSRYCQIVGRGLRVSPGKNDCLVLDYGNNIQRHGPLDDILPAEEKRTKKGDAPVKTCPKCYEVLHLSATECTHCGEIFERKINIGSTAATDDILSNQNNNGNWYSVTNWNIQPYQKAGRPPCIKVSYQTGLTFFDEYVFPEQKGANRTRFNTWWYFNAPGSRPPETVGEFISRRYELRKPSKIQVKKDGRFYNVAARSFK